MTIDVFLQTMKVLSDFEDRHGKAMNEIKMHPDDYEELRRDVGVFLINPAQGNGDQLFGVRVVVDPTAKRLPRKEST